MVDNNPIQRPGAGSIRPTGKTTSKAKPAAGKNAGGPAFQVLLEKLQEQARSLQQESETVAMPEQLSEAVGRAGDSLKDALSLSDQLLEAYRESQLGQTEPDTES